MKTFLRRTLPVLLASLCCVAPAAADGRWSVSASVGTIELDRTAKGSDIWWADIDDRSTGWGLNAGYLLHPRLGIRVGYERADDYDSFNQCPPATPCPALAIEEKVDFTAWHLAALPRFELGQGWAVYGVLGVMDWDIRGANLLPGDSGTAFRYGAGLSLQFGDMYELGLEYQAADIDYQAFRVNIGLRF